MKENEKISSTTGASLPTPSKPATEKLLPSISTIFVWLNGIGGLGNGTEESSESDSSVSLDVSDDNTTNDGDSNASGDNSAGDSAGGSNLSGNKSSGGTGRK